MYFSQLKAKLAQMEGYDIERVEKAYILAEKAHRGQKRKTGHDYIIHPVAVAERLLALEADEVTIIAALLHDTIEDTDTTKEQLETEFGTEVALLVDGMTKFRKNAFSDKKDLDAKIETIRKWLDVMRLDIRIAIIKMIDRLDNLQSLGVFPNEQKRIRIAQETLDIYSRVAEWLSMQNVRRELESDSLKFLLSPEQYDELSRKAERRNKKSMEICSIVTRKYHKHDGAGELRFEVAPLALQEAYFNRKFPVTLYCIAKSEVECYRALSFFHGIWRRRKNSFEDFINTPRVNGYRALESTIVLENGQEVNIRIMTPEMRRYHEYGVTTFCFSKGKEKPKLQWLEKLNDLLSTNKEKSFDFWNGIKSDLLEGFIIVHGPHDSIISLPRKSTYLDAAICALGKKAMYLKRVIAEKGIVTFRQRIEDGERIDFELSDHPMISYEWLQEVDNTQSIRMIKEALRDRKRTEKIDFGKELLQEEFDKYNLGLIDEIDENNLLVKCQDLDIQSLNELLQKIGEAYIFPGEVVDRLVPSLVSRQNGNGGKSLHFLRCQVLKNAMPAFFALLNSMIEKTKIRQNRVREELLDVDITIKCDRESKNNIIKEIRRAEGMRVVGEGRKPISMWFLLLLITLLWGLDPVIAKLLLDTELTPSSLTILRFAASAGFLGLILLFERTFRHSPATKRLVFFRPGLLLVSLAFFGVGVTTFFALVQTMPSDYVLSLYLGIFGLGILNFSLNNRKGTYQILLVAVIFFIGFGLLFSNPNWPITGKILALTAALSYGLYSFLNEKYQVNHKIFARHYELQFFISVYCTVISLILLFFFPWPNLGIAHYLMAVLFAVLFNTLPYILFMILVKRTKSAYFINKGLLATALIPLFLETIVIGAIPSLTKIASALVIMLGFLVLIKDQFLEQDKRI